MMIPRRGMGDDLTSYYDPSADAIAPASIDMGQVSLYGWAGVALALLVVFVGPRLMGGKTKGRRRRK